MRPREATGSRKFRLKRLKKTLDKLSSQRYTNRAAAWNGGRLECTLKIEQCKNSLCKNKHQRKGFLKRAEMFSRQFLLRAGKRIKRSDFRAQKWALRYDLLRVWSWLRMNAGGVPNTCKSNGVFRACFEHLVADGWVMYEQPAFQRGTTVGNDC